MNKNKGIWIAILSILVIGAGITWLTSTVIRRESVPMETMAAAQPGPAMFDAAQPYDPQGDDTVAETQAPFSPGEGGRALTPALASSGLEAAPQEAAGEETASESQPEGGEYGVAAAADLEGLAVNESPDTAAGAAEQAPENEVVITPLEPAINNSLTSGSLESGEYYKKRLEDIDAQIQKMRSNSTDPSTYTVQALADQELKLWNDEMILLYSTISGSLEQEALDALEVSQQTWIKDRDKKAEEAARKYSGGSLEGVEYKASLAESTRQRAYNLAGEYLDALTADEAQ